MRRRNSLNPYSRLLTVHFARPLPVLASLRFTLRAHSSGLPLTLAVSSLIFFSSSSPRILRTFPSPLNPDQCAGSNPGSVSLGRIRLLNSLHTQSAVNLRLAPSLRAPSTNSHSPLPPLTAPDNDIPTSPFSLDFPPTALFFSPRRSTASLDAPLPAQFPHPFPLSPTPIAAFRFPGVPYYGSRYERRTDAG